jgi:hypothetical protein
MSIFKNADSLKILPTDDEELSVKEITLLDMLYPNKEVKEKYENSKNGIKNGIKNVQNDNKHDSNDDDSNDEDEDLNESGNESKKKKTSLNEPSKTLKNSPKDIEKTWYHFNDIIIATVLFIILNIPISDRIIEKVIRTDNFYYKLGVKSIIFIVLLFFINNFILSRKQKQ